MIEHTRRGRILACVRDLVSAFLYHDRKDDRDLPIGAIEEAIDNGEITVLEITEAFLRAAGDFSPQFRVSKADALKFASIILAIVDRAEAEL